MIQLNELRPSMKQRVYDILSALNFDMADWSESLNNKKRSPSSNPKYCYNWSFIRDDKKVIVLFLWYEDMQIINGGVYQEHSFKQYSEKQEKGRKKRSLETDYAIGLAFAKNLPINVVICQGNKNTKGVSRRELDQEKWFVTAYDESTGSCIIERENNYQPFKFTDQFDSNNASYKHEIKRSEYTRSSVIRRKVLLRANGKCEYCSSDGFITNSGGKYLETHHIIPLSKGGDDSFKNVIALCPEDHRKAHFEKDSFLSQKNLSNIVKSKLTSGSC